MSCGLPQGFILGPLLFVIYVNVPQTVKSNLFLYTNDSCLMYQHRNVREIEKWLNKDLKNVFDRFLDNKLSIYFGEDKAKSILFASKCEIKSANKLNIKYKNKTTFAGYISWLCFRWNFAWRTHGLQSIEQNKWKTKISLPWK